MSNDTLKFIGNCVGAVILMQVLNIHGITQGFFFLLGLNLFVATRK